MHVYRNRRYEYALTAMVTAANLAPNTPQCWRQIRPGVTCEDSENNGILLQYDVLEIAAILGAVKVLHADKLLDSHVSAILDSDLQYGSI